MTKDEIMAALEKGSWPSFVREMKRTKTPSRPVASRPTTEESSLVTRCERDSTGGCALTEKGGDLRVLITSEECWGSVIGEDSDEGACQMCVYICAEVFEKPAANRCARVRLGVNPTPYAAQVREAAEYCPVDAIRIAEPRDSMMGHGVAIGSYRR